MGSKRNEFEESTKIKSSAEISEMLRSAGVSNDSSHEDFEHDVHTQVGNIAELIAKSREMGDPPAVRASSNVIRRTQTPVAIERVAIGSQSDIPQKTDDEAFEEMLGAAPATQDVEVDATIDERIALPLPAPPKSIETPKSKWRWGAVAWVVLLLATIGLGTMSYMKIAQLEDELASARQQLKK